jgi:hypothetical protein
VMVDRITRLLPDVRRSCPFSSRMSIGERQTAENPGHGIDGKKREGHGAI